jgi:soluble lytic murein transglycosylase-like protein
MPQFQPLPSFLPEGDALDLADARLEKSPVAPPFTGTLSTLMQVEVPRPVTTEDLPGVIPQKPAITTEQLAAMLGARSLSTTTQTSRVVRIPGARKASVKTQALAQTRRRMSPRLRQSIILVAVLFVAIFTLVSLAPLANGQSPFQEFKSFSDWVHSQQAYWQFEAQLQSTQPHPVATQPANLPPVYLPPSAYIPIAEQDASNAGISPTYFVRQINLESGFNPNAVSPSGAEGIAQFMPATAAELGINPFNPIQALNAAAHVMAGYDANYGGNYAMALAAYNAGSGTVQYAINACGPSNWMACLPAQTQNYIHVIMGI